MPLPWARMTQRASARTEPVRKVFLTHGRLTSCVGGLMSTRADGAGIFMLYLRRCISVPTHPLVGPRKTVWKGPHQAEAWGRWGRVYERFLRMLPANRPTVATALLLVQ